MTRLNWNYPNLSNQSPVVERLGHLWYFVLIVKPNIYWALTIWQAFVCVCVCVWDRDTHSLGLSNEVLIIMLPNYWNSNLRAETLKCMAMHNWPLLFIFFWWFIFFAYLHPHICLHLNLAEGTRGGSNLLFFFFTFRGGIGKCGNATPTSPHTDPGSW